MSIFRNLTAAAMTLPLLAATPALAQDDGSAADEERGNFTIGAGGMYRPSYEGSDDYSFGPAALIRGRVSGLNFYTRGTAFYVDLVPDRPKAPYSFEAGPMVNVRLDRTSGIKDEQVRALGKFDPAIEVGGFVGATKNGLLHDYDWLSVRLDVSKDVAGEHGSTIVSPSIDYATPLSPTFLVGLSLSADHVGAGYARHYFGIDAEGAAASGLSPYEIDEGGFKNWRTSLLLTQSLSGDLRRGLAAFALGSYSRLLGDFARSPIVADAGDRDQYFGVVGLAYTF